MKRLTSVLAIVTVIAVTISVAASAEGKKKRNKNRETNVPAEPAREEDRAGDLWMRAKLHASQDIFAGLTNGDLETVKRRSQGMLGVTILENWLRRNEFTQKSAYRGQLNAFEYANKELIRHAEDGDLDGTLEAWVLLSRSCVECHKLIRDPDKQ